MVKIVFMGSPEFAVPSLRLLALDHDVVGVVTRPDRPSGRGRHLTTSAIKSFALAAGLSVITPHELWQVQPMEKIRAWCPDIVVVAAFGQILKSEILELPRYGCVNLHASLLPLHRGASPVTAAIQDGDVETGVTLMYMDEGLDTGPILSQRSTPIHSYHTSGSLTEELAGIGCELLRDTLPAYLAWELTPVSQDASLATYSSILKKSDGHLDFNLPAERLARRVRAMDPWPGAFAVRDGLPLKILQARPLAGSALPGKVVLSAGAIGVGTGAGILQLVSIQASGGRPMAPDEYARGAPDFIGSTLE